MAMFRQGPRFSTATKPSHRFSDQIGPSRVIGSREPYVAAKLHRAFELDDTGIVKGSCNYFLNTLDAALAASASSMTGYVSSSNRLPHSATCCANAVRSFPSTRCQPKVEPGVCHRPTVLIPGRTLPPPLRKLSIAVL